MHIYLYSNHAYCICSCMNACILAYVQTCMHAFAHVHCMHTWLHNHSMLLITVCHRAQYATDPSMSHLMFEDLLCYKMLQLAIYIYIHIYIYILGKSPKIKQISTGKLNFIQNLRILSPWHQG